MRRPGSAPHLSIVCSRATNDGRHCENFNHARSAVPVGPSNQTSVLLLVLVTTVPVTGIAT